MSSLCWIRLLKTGRRTASVFPVPVGAINNTFFPANISGKASVCGSVGSLNPSSAKASRTGLARDSKADFEVCISKEHRLTNVLSFYLGKTSARAKL
jgi:hypothetical protein